MIPSSASVFSAKAAGIRVWSSTIFGVDHLHTLVVDDAHAVVAILADVGVAYNMYRLTGSISSPRLETRSMPFHLAATLARTGRKARSNFP